jgi:putative RNA 2'-phosphotransferase
VVAPERISRFLSFLLRHNPKQYALQFDRQGFVPWSQLLATVQKRFEGVTETQLRSVIAEYDKKRFELVDGKVRATYGHSVPVEQDLEPVLPPAQLYHATARDSALNILRQGLKPRDRHHVYLSTSTEEAMAVGKRRDPLPAVLMVASQSADFDGVQFYHSGNLYLTDQVPAQLLSRWRSQKTEIPRLWAVF